MFPVMLIRWAVTGMAADTSGVYGPGAAATAAGSIAVVVQDTTCPAAGLHKMRSPRDGGAPVGYAIVSSSGMVRYSTLDPEVTRLLDEVELMTKGVS